MITANYKGVADSLAMNQQRTVALVPNYPWIDDVKPGEVTSLRRDGDRPLLEGPPPPAPPHARDPSTADPMQEARAYVVYRFDKGVDVNIDNAEAIQCVTYKPEYALGADHGHFTYVVTVLDRANNESAVGEAINVKQ